MKTYVLTISKTFPTTHPRAGDPTYFKYKMFSLFPELHNKIIEEFGELLPPKIHTIRLNYELWLKRSEEINKGKAILSIREWEGKPYRSKQTEIFTCSEIGIQKLYTGMPWNIDGKVIPSEIWFNDGLNHNDFIDWFMSYPLCVNMAIIHFTDFRY